MANVTIRLDDADKKAFTLFCDDIGITVSNAVNMFVKKVVREQRIPFEVNNSTKKEDVFENLKQYKGIISENLDYEQEKLDSLDKKYENLY